MGAPGRAAAPADAVVASSVRALLDWYGRAARDLPWRRQTRPYGVWVSEIMLQQTQVKTVIPYWRRWMRALPTLKSLAEADSDRVLKLWEGLGYYRRARNLQAAARLIVTEHGGRFPNELNAIQALPGIGRYTAGAIASIAFNQPAPILDGNVMRVLTRLFAVSDPVDRAATQRGLWTLAEAFVKTAARGQRRGARPRCSHINQALMELGATICTSREPTCVRCPLRTHCRARMEGRAAFIPNTGDKPGIVRRRCAAVLVRRGSRFLMRRRAEGSVNGGYWEFPSVELPVEVEEGGRMAGLLEQSIANEFGFGIALGRRLGHLRHSITRYRIRLDAWDAALTTGTGGLAGTLSWVERGQLNDLALTSAHRKLAARFAVAARA